MSGPRPLPTEILKARNSRRVRKDSKEPRPDLTMPAPPKFLDEEGLAEWDLWADKLNEVGLLTSIDANDFGMYCELMAMWTECVKFLRMQDAMTYDIYNSDGDLVGMKTYPQVRIMTTLSKQILHLSDRFGMNPSARSRLYVDLSKQNSSEVVVKPVNKNAKKSPLKLG